MMNCMSPFDMGCWLLALRTAQVSLLSAMDMPIAHAVIMAITARIMSMNGGSDCNEGIGFPFRCVVERDLWAKDYLLGPCVV